MRVDEIVTGDCFDVMPSIASGSVDMILADPPYGTTRNRWDSVLDLERMWAEYRRVIKPNGAIVLCAQSPFDKALGMSNPEWFRYEWIWEKTLATGHLNARRAPMKAHENILVFYGASPTYNPQVTHGHERKVSTAEHKRDSKKTSNYGAHGLTTYDSTSRFPRSVLRFASDRQRSALHPTQKPVALFEYLIRTYTNEGDLVLDNVIGSGTTAVAALNTERHFIGIELDPAYAEVARRRLAETRAA